MVLDNEEDKNVLLNIINQTSFKGEIIERIAQLKLAIQMASITPEHDNAK